VDVGVETIMNDLIYFIDYEENYAFIPAFVNDQLKQEVITHENMTFHSSEALKVWCRRMKCQDVSHLQLVPSIQLSHNKSPPIEERKKMMMISE
jgi:hypothetical protein